MSKIIQADFNGQAMHFTSDAWFNATAAASHFGKEPSDWLRQRETAEYLAALSAHHGNSGFVEELNSINTLPNTTAASQAKLLRLSKQSGYVRTKAGSPTNGGGTWLHPKLAVRFAQWLDVRFAIWCDEQVDAIIRGHAGQESWAVARAAAASNHRLLCDMVNLHRQAIGKTSAAHHYANEARLINWAFAGNFVPIARDQLTAPELRLLELLERQDAVLLGMGKSYDERKTALRLFANAQRQRLALPQLAA
ncbi:KilA-N domain-containing protein (plasmid) [Chromobacterium amazonense]|uniref:KilA-N domain-containing protein n=1 Tax=Chromobacterium amazonense TaxID=1382803 RepID=UPI00237E3314|nr:KilA-N domain-containing protein [Chromobacterium amazonense]MDE1714505.1 KilA-N domain-containing protein [Chromobacterium amazonense]